MSCPSQSNWLAENVASAALYGGATVLIAELYRVWTSYRDLFRNAAYITERLDRIHLTLNDLANIFHDEQFHSVLNGREREGLESILKFIEAKSLVIQKQMEVFKRNPEPLEVDLESGNLAARNLEEMPRRHSRLHRTLTQLSMSFTNRVAKLKTCLEEFERDLERIQDNLSQMLLRYRLQLNNGFVESALARTHYRWTNQVAQLIQDPALFTEAELAEFNLSKSFTLFQCCDTSTNSMLNWYKFRDINGETGYVLVEARFGPYHYAETPRILENDSENLRAVYGLARQFKVANQNYNDKFGVLPCKGFYYDDLHNSTILIIWNPPLRFSGTLSSLKTLAEELNPNSDPSVLRAITKRLVKAVYELHLARWYHRSICLNNVIALDAKWENPYLVGFRTARFTDAHSVPLSRPVVSWKERYFQHPDRYDNNRPTTCRFRMKHDIYSLGVLLLELQKGRHFGSEGLMEETLGVYTGKSLQREFVKLAKNRDVSLLGDVYIAPIVDCLSKFDKLDLGDDTISHPRVLLSFRVNVLDPVLGAE